MVTSSRKIDDGGVINSIRGCRCVRVQMFILNLERSGCCSVRNEHCGGGGLVLSIKLRMHVSRFGVKYKMCGLQIVTAVGHAREHLVDEFECHKVDIE